MKKKFSTRKLLMLSIDEIEECSKELKIELLAGRAYNTDHIKILRDIVMQTIKEAVDVDILLDKYEKETK